MQGFSTGPEHDVAPGPEGPPLRLPLVPHACKPPEQCAPIDQEQSVPTRSKGEPLCLPGGAHGGAPLEQGVLRSAWAGASEHTQQPHHQTVLATEDVPAAQAPLQRRTRALPLNNAHGRRVRRSEASSPGLSTRPAHPVAKCLRAYPSLAHADGKGARALGPGGLSALPLTSTCCHRPHTKAAAALAALASAQTKVTKPGEERLLGKLTQVGAPLLHPSAERLECAPLPVRMARKTHARCAAPPFSKRLGTRQLRVRGLPKLERARTPARSRTPAAQPMAQPHAALKACHEVGGREEAWTPALEQCPRESARTPTSAPTIEYAEALSGPGDEGQ